MTYWFAGQRLTAKRLEVFVQRGTELVSFTTDDAVTHSVTFPVEFESTPIVFANINSGSGSTARWNPRAINVSTTGFNIFVYSPDGSTSSWTDVEVQWAAVAP